MAEEQKIRQGRPRKKRREVARGASQDARGKELKMRDLKVLAGDRREMSGKPMLGQESWLAGRLSGW